MIFSHGSYEHYNALNLFCQYPCRFFDCRKCDLCHFFDCRKRGLCHFSDCRRGEGHIPRQKMPVKSMRFIGRISGRKVSGLNLLRSFGQSNYGKRDAQGKQPKSALVCSILSGSASCSGVVPFRSKFLRGERAAGRERELLYKEVLSLRKLTAHVNSSSPQDFAHANSSSPQDFVQADEIVGGEAFAADGGVEPEGGEGARHVGFGITGG